MSSPLEPAAVAADARPFDPVAANADSVTPVAPPIEAAPRMSDVLRAGLTTGVTSALLCSLLWFVGWVFRTDFVVQLAGGDATMRINPVPILVACLVAALGFALVMTAFRRRRHCRRSVLAVGYVLGLASLAAPLLDDVATWPTKIWLILMHLLTMGLVVPQVARIVGDSDPYVTAGYRRTGLEATP